MLKNRPRKTINKRPSDYPQLAFRVKKEAKDHIMKQIDELTSLYNKKRKKDEWKYRKNELFMESLEIGLAELKKRANK